MSQPHIDTTLSNTHKDHQMCREMQQGGKGEVSHTLPSLILSPPSFHLPSSLPETCAHAVPADSFSSGQLMQGQLLFLPSPPFCSPNYSPLFISSLHCLHSSPLYFPLAFLYFVILPCTFPQADIKAGPVGRRGACVISGCT